ncbi:hypothetical protein B7R54_07230 [Subtercola boreus]|uniref:Type IV methyl-directed restriction enzyme EcoKMcrB subunit DNA-binding domain-containing protein n=1 Tax=Subtercola boreus TaxID=120213 RepID=A0A3E0VI26_9MICO|nr:DUF3578 domain-containing protein [Subtercola boreus]RFA09040.1 hypothetical protein B7R54_07230 [Subtercola boreus]TQL53962.1 uncharacterized protein DUF3578 [Subtercola boreus]
MDIGEFLRAVSANFVKGAATNTSPAVKLLNTADEALSSHTPEGFLVKGSGGKGNTTTTPWVAFMDTDETIDPQTGMYLVYIFKPTLDEVVLTLNQGVSGLSKRLGTKVAKDQLLSDAALIRAGLSDTDLLGLEPVVDFRVSRFPQIGYSVANIAARTYRMANLPPEESLRLDLVRFVSLYGTALAVKRDLLLRQPGDLHVPSPRGYVKPNEWEREFRPKNHADYLQVFEQRTYVKTRKHELLIREFGELKSINALNPSTNVHPRDMTLIDGPEEWLVEAKVIRNGVVTDAVRGAIGQLFEYRYSFYSNQPPRMLALFSEPIGSYFMDLLESLGIASVSRTIDGWQYSPSCPQPWSSRQ